MGHMATCSLPWVPLSWKGLLAASVPCGLRLRCRNAIDEALNTGGGAAIRGVVFWALNLYDVEV